METTRKRTWRTAPYCYIWIKFCVMWRRSRLNIYLFSFLFLKNNNNKKLTKTQRLTEANIIQILDKSCGTRVDQNWHLRTSHYLMETPANCKCQHFNNNAFILLKTVMETQLEKSWQKFFFFFKHTFLQLLFNHWVRASSWRRNTANYWNM